MGYERQFGGFLLAPATTVPLLMPDEVDGPLAQSFPSEHQDGVLVFVDFND
jgi:hypothetical protein